MGACLSEGCGYSFRPIDKFADVLKSVEKRPLKNCMIFSDDIKIDFSDVTDENPQCEDPD